MMREECHDYRPVLSRLQSDSSSDECPIIPMGAVTGRPTRARLRETLTQYASAGITQFLVYPRSGCELEYLSEEWFGTVEALVEEAQSLGFTSIWLYDEFNWPSGQAGGRVMAAREDFRLQTLEVTRGQDGRIEERVVGNPRFPNLLNPEAVELFVSLTHEAYAHRLGRFFGTLIRGIFTDEPSPGYVGDYVESDTSAKVSLAWYPGMEDDYRAETGRSLREDIARRLRGEGDAYSPAYHLLLGRRFRSVFFDRVRGWCDAHGLLLTGHLMGENGGIARRFSGDPLLVSDGFSLPGVDEITTYVTAGQIEWQTLSGCRHAIEANGHGGLAELYAYGPSDMPLARFRQMMWVMAAFGIDRYVQAVSQLDARGNASKSAWYNPLSPTQTWFPHYREFGADAKAAARLARRPCGPELGVRYVEDCWRLPATLQALVRRQRPWRMLGLDEAPRPGTPAVLDVSGGRCREELSGREFDGMEAFLDWLDEASPRAVSVLESSGESLAQEVLVRPYADGSVLVVDLRDGFGEEGAMADARRLRLRVSGHGECAFTLEHRGVEVLEPSSSAPPAPMTRTREVCVPAGRWSLALERDNLLCPEFAGVQGTNGRGFACLRLAGDEPAFVVTVREPLTGVRAVIRRYAGEPRVLLDGHEMVCARTCVCLPDGLRELYGETEAFSLTPGEHELRLSGGGVDDYWYLPCVFLAGAMAVGGTESAVTLAALPAEVPQGDLADRALRNYAGRVRLTRRVRVPSGARALRLRTNGMVTEALLDGVSLGTRCWAPFVWELPPEAAGREATLTVALEVPVGAMFGRARLQTLRDFAAHRRIPGFFGFCGVYGVTFEVTADAD